MTPQPFTVVATRPGIPPIRITLVGLSLQRVILTAQELFPTHTITATPDGEWAS